MKYITYNETKCFTYTNILKHYYFLVNKKVIKIYKEKSMLELKGITKDVINRKLQELTEY